MRADISASRQIGFHQLLVAARKTWLRDALTEALRDVDPNQLKAELTVYVPVEAQKILAVAGIRDEFVFPVPVVLRIAPTLVGYYRLLLGIPQKTFYGTGSGMGVYKTMETKGLLRQNQIAALPEFCRTMSIPLCELVLQISPSITQQDINELPLLTLGSQFQGGNNNTIGKQATVDVFLAIISIVDKHIVDRTEQRIKLKNSAGRTVIITLAGDPDVRVEEELGGAIRKAVAIEIKGGTDKSNAHNRAGEAEKSHQKATNAGYRDCWTIIATGGLDLRTLKSESPTTNEWFDAAQVLRREGSDWTNFVHSLCSRIGIPLDDA